MAVSLRFPYQRCVLHTKRRLDELCDLLRAHTRPDGGASTWRFDESDSRELVGSVREHAFSVRPRLRYRNSFVPYVFGRLEGTSRGTKITIIMRPHAYALVMLTFWMSMSTLAAVGALAAVFLKGATLGLLVPLLPLFGALLSAAMFGHEANKVEALLRDILEVEGR